MWVPQMCHFIISNENAFRPLVLNELVNKRRYSGTKYGSRGSIFCQAILNVLRISFNSIVHCAESNWRICAGQTNEIAYSDRGLYFTNPWSKLIAMCRRLQQVSGLCFRSQWQQSGNVSITFYCSQNYFLHDIKTDTFLRMCSCSTLSAM